MPITKEQAQKELRRRAALKELARRKEVEPDVEEKAEATTGGFVSNVTEDLAKREGQLKAIDQAKDSGEQGAVESGFQKAGVAGGAIFDVAEEGVKEGVKAISAIVPDFIEDPVKKHFSEAGEFILQTEVGKAGLEALQNGVEAWDEFKKERPRAARNIEATVNVGLILTPLKSKPTTKSPRTQVGDLGKAAERRAVRQQKKIKKKLADSLVMEEGTKKAAERRVESTVVKGRFQKSVAELTHREDIMAKELAKTQIDPKNTIQKNWNITRDAVRKEADSLLERLKANDVIMPKKETKNTVQSVIQGLKQEHPLFVGDVEKSAERVFVAASKFIDESSGTASGLLQARMKFDRFAEKIKPTVFGDKHDAISIAVREIRSEMNDIIDRKVRNVAVKRSLKKQSLLLDSMDVIKPKAANEAATALGRLSQDLTSRIPIKSEIGKQIGLLAVAGASGSAVLAAPKLAVGAGAVLLANKLVHGVASANSKQLVAKILKLSDKMLRTIKDESVISRVKADRAVLLSLIGEESINAVRETKEEEQ